MDIFWWLASTGRLARTIDDVPDVSAARRETSLQLVGRNDPELLTRTWTWPVLQAHGVRLAGRLERVADGRAWFRDDLAESVAAAERRMHRFLDTVDDYVARAGLDTEIWPPVRPRRRPRAVRRRHRLNLRAERIGTVLLATGYRPHHPWLQLPITAPGRQHRAIPWRDGRARGVRGRPTVPAPPRLRIHRRRPARRRGDRPSPAAPGRRSSRRAGHGLRGAGGMNRYDVVVVGGRVAGASTALLLARAGLRVALIERSRPGSDIVSTHGLMRAGVAAAVPLGPARPDH